MLGRRLQAVALSRREIPVFHNYIVQLILYHAPAQTFPSIKFPTISRPVLTVIRHTVPQSNVLVSASAYPNASIPGIQPRAYSSAKQASRMEYCLTSPLRR